MMQRSTLRPEKGARQICDGVRRRGYLHCMSDSMFNWQGWRFTAWRSSSLSTVTPATPTVCWAFAQGHRTTHPCPSVVPAGLGRIGPEGAKAYSLGLSQGAAQRSPRIGRQRTEALKGRRSSVGKAFKLSIEKVAFVVLDPVLFE